MTTAQRELWPGWETIRLLGRGSFGAVYEIQRNFFGHTEKAALKVISIPQNDSDIQAMYHDGYNLESITRHYKSYLRSIVKEYALMTEIKGHTNIVYCDDLKYVLHNDGIGWDIYIKMELLQPLTDVIGDIPDEQTVIQIGLDICNALALCKERSIVHRDVKPQNIFVSEDGNYKLGDFGIARTIEQTTCGAKTGTYKYMAPEVYNLQPYGSRADIYSLGLTLYWLLNERRTPFLPAPPKVPTVSETENALYQRFSGKSILPPVHGSSELKHIVLKACAFDPKDRYESAAEMRRALDALRKEDICDDQNRCIIADDASTVLLEPMQQDTDAKQDVEAAAIINRDYAERKTMTAPEITPASGRNRFFIVIAALALAAVLLFAVLGMTGGKAPQNDSILQKLECEGEEITSTFPDDAFCAYIWTTILGKDMPVQEGYKLTEYDSMQIASQTELIINDAADITGIAYFVNLERLSGKGCAFTVLDISQNQNIKELILPQGNLQVLTLGELHMLEIIDIEGNHVATLNVRNCPNLKILRCGMNALTELDVSQNTMLESLSCGGNSLTELDVSNNSQLRILHCSYNQIGMLDVSKNTLLTEENMIYDTKVTVVH